MNIPIWHRRIEEFSHYCKIFWVIASCKFKESLISENELQLMEEYADAMGHLGHRYYYLFSRSGYNTSLLKRAGNEKLRLITLRDMYRNDDFRKSAKK